MARYSSAGRAHIFWFGPIRVPFPFEGRQAPLDGGFLLPERECCPGLGVFILVLSSCGLPLVAVTPSIVHLVWLVAPVD